MKTLSFRNSNLLYQNLTKDLSSKLEKSTNGLSIGLAGGSSLDLLYEKLVKKNIDWSKFTLTLIDERCVSINDSFSNFGNLKRRFIDYVYPKPKTLQLYKVGTNLNDYLAKVENKLINNILPFDIIVISIGNDGHVASIFPDLDDLTLENLIYEGSFGMLKSIKTNSSIHSRITMNISTLSKSSFVYLILPTKIKVNIFRLAMLKKDEKKYPIYALIKKLVKSSFLTIYEIDI